MKLDELFEMSPQNILPIEHHVLDDRDKNRLYAYEILRDKKGKIIPKLSDEHHKLIEFPNRYVFIEQLKDKQPRVAYFVQFTVAYKKFLGRQCVQQVLVWRNKAVGRTKGLAETIFFEYLLPKYGTVITDSQQTTDGQGFWDIRITDALRHHAFVYFVDIMPPRVIQQIKSEHEYDDIKRDKKIWGDSSAHQTKRIIITFDPIES